jgi:hypothetical protein
MDASDTLDVATDVASGYAAGRMPNRTHEVDAPPDLSRAESNRGHHDSQARAGIAVTAPKLLQFGKFRVLVRLGMGLRKLRSSLADSGTEICRSAQREVVYRSLRRARVRLGP